MTIRFSRISRSPLLYPACVLLVFVLLLLRQGAELTQPPIVWEDGTLFLSDACCHPFFTNVFGIYVGYIHLVPRIIAEMASLVNLLYAPLIFRLSSVFIAAMALCFPITSLFRTVLPPSVRFLLVALTALLPWHAETLGNIASIHWYLCYVLILLSMADTRVLSRKGILLLLAVCFVSVFSSPLCVLTIPLFLWRLFRTDTTRSERVIDGATLLMMGIMLIFVKMIMTAPSTPEGIAEVSNDARGILLFMVKALGYKVIGITLAGQAWAKDFLQKWPLSFLGIVLFGLCCSAFRSMRRISSDKETPSFRFPYLPVLLYYILVPLLFTAVMRPHYVTHFVANNAYYGANRYFLIPTYMGILFVLLLIHDFAENYRTWWSKLTLVALACCYVVVIQKNYFYTASSDYGWQEEIGTYYSAGTTASNAENEFYLITLPHDPPWHIKLPQRRQ